jgi:hypothetical protein
LKERLRKKYKRHEDEKEDVSSYWTTLRERDDTAYSEKQH